MANNVTQKPVWRMNTGNGVPSDTKIHPVILFRDGKVTYSVSVAGKWVWTLRGKSDDIAAYQTNRTKAANFERVMCESCTGTGSNIFCDCNKCNGTGRMVRRIV